MHPKRNLKIQIVQYLGGLIEDYTGNIFVKKYASNEQRKTSPRPLLNFAFKNPVWKESILKEDYQKSSKDLNSFLLSNPVSF